MPDTVTSENKKRFQGGDHDRVFNRHTNVAILVLVLTILINGLFKAMPSVYDSVYYRSVFQGLRIVFDHTLGYLPIPLVYLLFFFLVYKLGHSIYRLIKRRYIKGIRTIIQVLLWMVILFYLLWGFHYTQPSVENRMGLKNVSVDTAYISQAFQAQTEVINDLSYRIDRNLLHYNELENRVRLALREEYGKWGFQVKGRVRVQKILPGSLLHFKTTGIYIPHVLQGHIDGGMYKVQWPFTVAHEMSHGYGFTDEGVCNFLAYLICIHSGDIRLEYSAELAYWRYLASYYYRIYPQRYQHMEDLLSRYLVEDLAEIRKANNKYKEWLPNYRDKIYDKYLKTHGVHEGIMSYDKMITLIAAWRKTYEG